MNEEEDELERVAQLLRYAWPRESFRYQNKREALMNKPG